ncbi:MULTISPECIES: efflux RND transporter periplasmic adaptor subunit [Sphingobium]|uniref:Efflux RND transporter periplasmic adaptor subunit n=1 Tax=Sphingobium cupriresistens TaxID=1132417 RepID=A0A8G2DXE2_9SPHN|nr:MULTISPECIES: efflux RND transporter periplasmic adaptor subunit [Sphingobium]RYM09976.1 efflux RND transporter periplasmic adaptor subunit [Sphingobium cupriresistens]WCP15535.1 Multidrug resistance protein MdtA [Sphingobium sp. AntQ-1]
MNMITKIDADAPAGEIRAEKAGKRWSGRHVAWAALALAIVVGVSWKYAGQPQAQAAAPVVTVGVAAPLMRQVVQWDDYVGRFAPSQTVDVRPRVSGPVTAIHFRDGDIVRQGQLLFTLDQRPFLAALAEARANVASARSGLRLAQADYARVQRLNGDEAVSASEIDTLRARLQAAQAALAAADARARTRALDVEFTLIRAPISGRVSDRKVDIGNLVSGAEGAGASLLTTINALDPIYFSFDASEALFLKSQRDHADGHGGEVEIRLQDESDYRWKGRLDFTDNGLDPRSGTIRGRAVLSNPDLFLTPGLFGNMRLSSGGKVNALLVPDEAIQSDQALKTVLVVGRDDVVAAKPVQLGPLVDGLRIIRSGLSPQDKVVVANVQAAMPGAKVATRGASIRAVAAPITPTDGAVPVASQATFER